MSGNKEPLSIYIHTPFCKKKCPYCQFYSITHYEEWLTRYEKALLQEIENVKPSFSHRNILSIYFGGGTPFLLHVDSIEKILKAFPQGVPEITIEANPETITLEKLIDIRKLGINRISIGVQSFHDNELKTLGRSHTQKTALDAIYAAYTAGFSNISIDLMYELPGQTLLSWKETLSFTKFLPITHLSLYNLVIEEGTPFAKKESALRKTMPGDAIGKEMYEEAIDALTLHGFEHYEISAFSKPNFYSLHNIGYWIGRDFLGFGPAAFSSIGNTRHKNVSNISHYVTKITSHESPIDFIEEENEEEHRKLVFILSLRLLSGALLPQKLQSSEIATQLKIFEKERLLSVSPEGFVILTRRGILFYDTIASELL